MLLCLHASIRQYLDLEMAVVRALTTHPKGLSSDICNDRHRAMHPQCQHSLQEDESGDRIPRSTWALLAWCLPQRTGEAALNRLEGESKPWGLLPDLYMHAVACAWPTFTHTNMCAHIFHTHASTQVRDRNNYFKAKGYEVSERHWGNA